MTLKRWYCLVLDKIQAWYETINSSQIGHKEKYYNFYIWHEMLILVLDEIYVWYDTIHVWYVTICCQVRANENVDISLAWNACLI